MHTTNDNNNVATEVRIYMMNNNRLPVMITVKEAAKATGLAEYYLRKLCITGQIKAVKNGKKYYINEASLCDFLSKMMEEVE